MVSILMEQLTLLPSPYTRVCKDDDDDGVEMNEELLEGSKRGLSMHVDFEVQYVDLSQNS